MMKVLLKKAKQKLQTSLENASPEQTGLRQSRIWGQSVTWTLIGISAFGIGWLAIAQTEEIIVVPGKLEPKGAVQEVRLPIGGVVEQVLVKEGETVNKGQVLIRLDTRLTRDRRLALETALNLKRQQLEAKQRELDESLRLSDSTKATLESRVKLQADIVRRLNDLEAAGASSKLQFLQEQNRLEETRGELDRVELERNRQLAVLAQARQQLRQEEAQLKNQVSEQGVNLEYQEIRSPVAGQVFDLKPTGAGYVAQGNEPVLQVVPQDQLQAKVEIASREIGFVRVGQQAEISIDSYPSTDFGVLMAKVTRLSSDALPPKPNEGKNEYRFPAVLTLAQQQLSLPQGQKLPLQAGMSLQAHIHLRKTTYLGLLLSNLSDKSKSLQGL